LLERNSIVKVKNPADKGHLRSTGNSSAITNMQLAGRCGEDWWFDSRALHI